MSIADGWGRSAGHGPPLRSVTSKSSGQSLDQVHRAHQVAEAHGVLAVEEQAWSRHRPSVVRRRAQARAVARTPSRSLIVARSTPADRAGRPLDEEGRRCVPEQVVARRRAVVRREQGLAGGLGGVGVDLVARAGAPEPGQRAAELGGGRPDARLVEVDEADAAVVDQHVLRVEVAVQQDARTGRGCREQQHADERLGQRRQVGPGRAHQVARGRHLVGVQPGERPEPVGGLGVEHRERGAERGHGFRYGGSGRAGAAGDRAPARTGPGAARAGTRPRRAAAGCRARRCRAARRAGWRRCGGRRPRPAASRSPPSRRASPCTARWPPSPACRPSARSASRGRRRRRAARVAGRSAGRGRRACGPAGRPRRRC